LLQRRRFEIADDSSVLASTESDMNGSQNHISGSACTTMPSSWLVARPRFLKGVGSVFGMFGYKQPYNYSSSNDRADSAALMRDGYVVGQEMRDALRRVDAAGSK
jgi:hypothetical protein